MNELVAAALISALTAALMGSIFGALSQFLFQFLIPERLKEKRQLRRLTEKYSNPILLACSDLTDRIDNIIARSGHIVLHEGWEPSPSWPITHEYFLGSTMYLFARYFCWVDIFRREVQFLDFGEDETNKRVRDFMEEVEQALSSDSPNKEAKPDIQVYRQQQRAIGEIMSVGQDGDICLGYSDFCEKMKAERFANWLTPLKALVLNIEQMDGSFRWTRLALVRSALARLAVELDPEGRRIGKENLRLYKAFAGLAVGLPRG